MPSELFRIAVGRRLRVKFLQEFATCPCCGAALDAYMDHALVCACRGDRTLRHNSARDSFFVEAREAGVRAEREKLGLLPLRPGDESLRGERLSNGRRPADVWFPGWSDNSPCAVDFAITSGLQVANLASAASDPASIWGSYEEFKRRHLDTEERCLERGFIIRPFIIEAHGGGFGPVARRICARVAKAAAATSGEDVEVKAADLLRRISISLHRENARAILRRLPTQEGGSMAPSPAAWAEEAHAWQ